MCGEVMVVVVEVRTGEDGSEDRLHVSEWEGPRWTTLSSGTVRISVIRAKESISGQQFRAVEMWKWGEEAAKSRWEKLEKSISKNQGKVYEVVVRAAMLFGLETVALRGKQEAELEVAEMRDVERLLWE